METHVSKKVRNMRYTSPLPSRNKMILPSETTPQTPPKPEPADAKNKLIENVCVLIGLLMNAVVVIVLLMEAVDLIQFVI